MTKKFYSLSELRPSHSVHSSFRKTWYNGGVQTEVAFTMRPDF